MRGGYNGQNTHNGHSMPLKFQNSLETARTKITELTDGLIFKFSVDRTALWLRAAEVSVENKRNLAVQSRFVQDDRPVVVQLADNNLFIRF